MRLNFQSSRPAAAALTGETALSKFQESRGRFLEYKVGLANKQEYRLARCEKTVNYDAKHWRSEEAARIVFIPLDRIQDEMSQEYPAAGRTILGEG
jgi:hypothetical protein